MLQHTKQLIAPWPNTYTFTKNLAERALRKYREAFPVLILRPAIIICAYQQPYPGWLDSLAAAGSISMLISSGAVHYFAASRFSRGDMIPVDFVSNSILVGTASQAGSDSLTVAHCASSHLNPVTWKRYSQHVLDYSRVQPMDQRLGTLSFRVVSKPAFEVSAFLQLDLAAVLAPAQAASQGPDERVTVRRDPAVQAERAAAEQAERQDLPDLRAAA